MTPRNGFFANAFLTFCLPNASKGNDRGDDYARSQKPEIRRFYFRNRNDGGDADRHDGGEKLRRGRLHDRGHRVRPPVVADWMAMSAEEVQRLQISVIATTASVSSPTKRITIVPTLCDDCRSGIEFMLSG